MKLNDVKFELSCGFGSQLIKSDLPEIAFSGRSNVGKSSLLNRFFSRKALARVSSVPGKTVTVNFFKADGVHFVDLPGYGYAKVSRDEKLRWAELLESYFSSGRNIRLVVQLIDMRHEMSAQDREMLEFLKGSGYNFLVVLTKCDKLNKKEREEMFMKHCTDISKIGGISVVPFSAVTGEGTAELKRLVEIALGEEEN